MYKNIKLITIATHNFHRHILICRSDNWTTIRDGDKKQCQIPNWGVGHEIDRCIKSYSSPSWILKAFGIGNMRSKLVQSSGVTAHNATVSNDARRIKRLAIFTALFVNKLIGVTTPSMDGWRDQRYQSINDVTWSLSWHMIKKDPENVEVSVWYFLKSLCNDMTWYRSHEDSMALFVCLYYFPQVTQWI